KVVLDFDGRAVIVPVQPFALVSLVADEVPRAEDQVIFGDPDFVTFAAHGAFRIVQMLTRTRLRSMHNPTGTADPSGSRHYIRYRRGGQFMHGSAGIPCIDSAGLRRCGYCMCLRRRACCAEAGGGPSHVRLGEQTRSVPPSCRLAQLFVSREPALVNT